MNPSLEESILRFISCSGWVLKILKVLKGLRSFGTGKTGYFTTDKIKIKINQIFLECQIKREND
jgi:hypothetical protein